MTRHASCSCGQLHATIEGEPVRVSICHCLTCQQRTGSAFGYQARFPAADVRIEGRFTKYVRISDGGESRTFSFCPDCGATVFYKSSPDLIAIPVGVLGEPGFPAPTVSVWEDRKHDWVGLPDSIQHIP